MTAINNSPSRVENKQAGGSLTALAGGLLLIMLGMWFSPGAHLSTGAALLIVSVAGGFATYGLNRYITPDPVDEHDAAEMSPGQLAMMGGDMGELGGNPEVRRICEAAFNFSDTLAPVAQDFSFTDGDLDGFGFVSHKTGFLATEATKNRLTEALSGVLGSGWKIDFDTTKDSVTGSKKSSVPKLALPEMWNVVTSPEEAAAKFDDFEVVVGLGENGPIKFSPKKMPHRELVGATGGGKSVAARAEIMQYLAAGYQLFAIDGKSTDYAPFLTYPNFSAVSTNLREHVLVIHAVYSILMQRRARGAAMSKRGDNSWRETMHPILLVIDEFASVRNNMKAELTPKEVKLIERDLGDILKVGREFRVNVMLATQDMKADTVPTDWKDMFIVVQSLGAPAPMTINKAFPETIQGQVRRLGATISRKVPGRALVAVTDENGNVSAELYQAFWSYSPAETITSKLPKEVRANWEQFKTVVADRVPKMYPRLWFKMEYPDPKKDGDKDPYAEDRDEGWVDLNKISVEDLHRMPPVLLEDKTTFAPIPENQVYDPLAEGYLGEKPFDLSGGDEMAALDF